jgi:hypothetical protein
VYGELRFGSVVGAILKIRLADANNDLEWLGFENAGIQTELAEAKQALGEAIDRAAKTTLETEKLRAAAAWRKLGSGPIKLLTMGR